MKVRNKQQKRVLVTGATGFLGAYLLKYLLREGYQIRAIKRKSSSMDLVKDIEDQVEWIEANILNQGALEKAMQGVDYVYHSAAVVSYEQKEAAYMHKVNVEGTANVVNTALLLGVEKLLFISSIAAIGNSKKKDALLDENNQWENSTQNTNYAISKFMAECEVWRAIAEGLNAVIVNPSVILGAGHWNKGSAAIISSLKKGLYFYPQGSTGFVDVRDVAQASIALMQSDLSGERFILNAVNKSYKELFQEICMLFKVAQPKRKLPMWGIQILWRLEYLRALFTGKKAVITRELAMNLSSTKEYSNQKLVSTLAFEYRPFTQTLEDSVRAFRQSQQENKQYHLLEL